MLIAGELIQQAPSHVPNPIPKDQCTGSVQDQVIRAPENCKAIPEQLLLSQEGSELSALLYRLLAPRLKGTPGVYIYFCPAKEILGKKVFAL